MPGTAKTVLTRALAASVDGAATTRIQCTPDLQPTDVTGLSVYDQTTLDFELRNLELLLTLKAAGRGPSTGSGRRPAAPARARPATATEAAVRPVLISPLGALAVLAVAVPLAGERRLERVRRTLGLGAPPCGSRLATALAAAAAIGLLAVAAAQPATAIERRRDVRRLACRRRTSARCRR